MANKEDVKEVIQGALSSGSPLIRECERVAGRGRGSSLLYRRAKRHLEKIPSGPYIFERFLGSDSAYELDACALLSCKPEELSSLIPQQGIPIHWLGSSPQKDAEERRSSYIFWYNRLLRESHAFRKNRTLLSKRSILSPSQSEGGNFFELTDYELSHTAS